MIIAVIGGGYAVRSDLLEAAEAVGRQVALQGATLTCGGLGGVMEAAFRGARGAGGHTIGVLPRQDAGEANEYVEFPIVTGLGRARNVIVVLSADAVIAVDGSYGTLSEIGHALQEGNPVIGLSTWELTQDGEADNRIVRTNSPEAAVQLALAAARGDEPALGMGP